MILRFKYNIKIYDWREISIVFQNYVSSVNPKFSVAEIIAEPLTIESQLKKDEIQEELKKLIESVGLSEEFLQRFPNEQRRTASKSVYSKSNCNKA